MMKEFIMSVFHTTRAKEIIANAKQNELFTAIVSDISEALVVERYNFGTGLNVKLEGYLDEAGDFVQIDGDTWKYAMLLDENGYTL